PCPAGAQRRPGDVLVWLDRNHDGRVGHPRHSRDAAAGTDHQKNSAGAGLDHAACRGPGPDLRAELLLALVAGRGTSLEANMTMMMRTIALAAGVALALGANAFAGGDDYDASNDTEGAGPAYFGF